MVYQTDEITRQARQGSVAAIIQLLNENLAANGIRVRAILENGVLQLLCEAESVEQLEKSTLVPLIKELLETIGPKNIRRVKINSRIVREQQLLWLEEISRDPENQLLWFEEIILARRNPFGYLGRDFNDRKYKLLKQPLAKASSSPFERDRRQWRRGMIGGVLFSLCLLLLGWVGFKLLNSNQKGQISSINAGSAGRLSSTQQKGDGSSLTDQTNDPFALAVRMAEQTSKAGKTAQSRAKWLEIANRWQQASDLMGKVAKTDARYQTAQNRKMLYRKNSEAALREVGKRRS